MTDESLLDRVLRPYKAHCKYLKSADVTERDGRLTARCTFSIPESCYIDDTGHLNSVEVNICYNQMMYYLVARSVQEGLGTAFAGWTPDDFWKRQLPDILIARFSSSFRRPVNPRDFSGEMEFRSVTLRAPAGGLPFLHAETAFRYWDSEAGRCDGEAVLAIVNIP
ncbi:FcoT family thioesterase [Streptomyces caniscabiei]|uniref:(2E)-enoyl-[ACP] glycyltransferase n=1 Tax=Streptomyces caniscabiei TaxID=2746961 RepID=A0A927L069_9ACTN|nr:FcoT family thioesterase [Streptomyces caniscabiei]MBD9722526.1 FcoT family thioesterase [Streptomyces caniscabiei]MDX3515199.1 FcoT family thioesterase [Streptomyces caniscabiei]MDX3716519.1 FcoT family thioesterase [Streptomyces caniscabiei]MDX3732046.1 FcoT family thioesterase [Streptomyces caniscabiei]WEO22416.1 FcoT family thioesterase [Streptomyces caniscabiei]